MRGRSPAAGLDRADGFPRNAPAMTELDRFTEARRRGAVGVPTFFLDYHMYWGNARLALLEAYLRRRAGR
jgi:2-hydroxychromene-2-carboxylate isomerase